MAHESSEGRVAPFAFYLPQFYPMPLNSAWWGDGFTEWTAVLNAQRGVRSPSDTRISPGQLGFYDLRLRETRVQQGILAQQHGLEALCIYHYYSRGDRVTRSLT